MAQDLDALLAIADRTLRVAGVAHALIGGCARNVYAPPRSTRDVDMAVVVSDASYRQIASKLRGMGFVRVTETRTDDASVPDVALFSDDTGGRIDLLIAHTSFEERAIAAATPMVFPSAGASIPVVKVEDLIVYKVLASRPRDLLDIEDIVRFQRSIGTVLDWSHIEAECAHWDALDVVQQLRERLQPGP